MASAKHRIVIIGGGFGGLEAAKMLDGPDVTITLIDRVNHHLFQPLLYQVATGGLSSPAIAAPIRHILRERRNVVVILGEVTSIDVERRVVSVGREEPCEYAYDSLIIAAGAGHSYFGHDDWAQYAPGLKTLDDALEIRRRILTAFEYAEREPDRARRDAWLHFVVIGGGPTGVEMAGTLAEIGYHTLRAEFRNLDLDHVRVMLLEGSDRILSAYPPELSIKAQRQLEKLGVIVRTGAQVGHIDGEGVTVGKEDERIPARTVIWGAGVAASSLGRQLGVPLDKAGRVIVGRDLSIPLHPEVYVIGDLASYTDPDGKPVPGVSPAAKQMGRCAAGNILLRMAGKTTRTFRYKDYGSLATIGRNSAIAALGRFRFSGFSAWLFWLFVHVYFLIGFRNRMVVLADWAWAYWTYERHARIIVGTEREKAR